MAYNDSFKKLNFRHIAFNKISFNKFDFFVWQRNSYKQLAGNERFSPESEPGEGYSYSGEALLYLQKVIETKTGKNLEALAKEYVFVPLGMERSTFLPQPEDDTNIVV